MAGVAAFSHAALAAMLPARATGLPLCCTGQAAQHVGIVSQPDNELLSLEQEDE